jgi:tetratricopeptide (TPR) repeat protein
MLGEKEKVKECYLALVDSNSSSSFACKFWLDLESQSINLPELNSLIDLYEEASQVYKDLNLLKAFYFFKSKNYISAIELLSKISERNKNGFLCTTLMGICYFQVRNLRKSSIFFYISACSNRNSPEAWFNLAKIYYECDNSKAYDALKFVNGLDHGESPFLKEINEDFVVVPFNFAKFCKFDESCMRKVEKVGRKRGKKPKDMAVKCLENDALLLWQLKENKRTKYVEDESS